MRIQKIIFGLVLMIGFSVLSYSQSLTNVAFSNLNFQNRTDLIDNSCPVKIHYLGHSSFVLLFDNGVTVVTDYGKYNAWAPDWDSPIFDIGKLVPDVMTFSHKHADHYDPNRVTKGVAHILFGSDSLEINGVKIKPIRTCEVSVKTEDNSSYLFSYKGYNILHLADAQAQIKSIEQEAVKNHISQMIPKNLDLLFMTIEGTSKFIPQAALFIDLIKPKRIIPMHFWSIEYRNDFETYLAEQNKSGKKYSVQIAEMDDYTLIDKQLNDSMMVYNLKRLAYSPTVINTNILVPTIESKEVNIQCSPNPFKSFVQISYKLHKPTRVKLSIYNLQGQIVKTLVNCFQDTGNYLVHWNSMNDQCQAVGNGLYICKVETNDFKNQVRIMLIRK